MRIAEFIRQRRLAMRAEWADSNPNMVGDPKWAAAANHWKCTLRHGRKRMTVYFSQGPAINHEPELKSVLDSLASDASLIEDSRDFEDFARELGYDPDSRKAERSYDVTRKQTDRFKRFLGAEAFEQLLFHVERE
jgi:hypothetical protein